MNPLFRWSIRDHNIITKKYELLNRYGHDNKAGSKGTARHRQEVVRKLADMCNPAGVQAVEQDADERPGSLRWRVLPPAHTAGSERKMGYPQNKVGKSIYKIESQ